MTANDNDELVRLRAVRTDSLRVSSWIGSRLRADLELHHEIVSTMNMSVSVSRARVSEREETEVEEERAGRGRWRGDKEETKRLDVRYSSSSPPAHAILDDSAGLLLSERVLLAIDCLPGEWDGDGRGGIGRA